MNNKKNNINKFFRWFTVTASFVLFRCVFSCFGVSFSVGTLLDFDLDNRMLCMAYARCFQFNWVRVFLNHCHSNETNTNILFINAKWRTSNTVNLPSKYFNYFGIVLLVLVQIWNATVNANTMDGGNGSMIWPKTVDSKHMHVVSAAVEHRSTRGDTFSCSWMSFFHAFQFHILKLKHKMYNSTHKHTFGNSTAHTGFDGFVLVFRFMCIVRQ